VRLLQTMPCLDQVLPIGGPLPAVDARAWLLSLPSLVGTRLETVPAETPYLAAPEPDQALWRRLMAGRPRPMAGVVWRGSAKHPQDRRRSINLGDLAPALAGFPGELVSLQQDAGRAEIAMSPLAGRLLDPLSLCRPPRERFLDFADTAGLVAELDLVVAVDTAVAHLAGALGKPCFVLLPAVGDFRWLVEGAESPWYPTMRLFRQPRDGDWATPFGRLAEALARFGDFAAQGPR